jgi:uncharacterized protein (DUF433 family)
MTSLNRITIDATACHGKSCTRGILSIADILDDYPELEREDIINHARLLLSGQVLAAAW